VYVDNGVVLQCEVVWTGHLAEILLQLVAQVGVGSSAKGIVSTGRAKMRTVHELWTKEGGSRGQVVSRGWHKVGGGFQLVDIDEEEVVYVPDPSASAT
jgi:hypothetical protein